MLPLGGGMGPVELFNLPPGMERKLGAQIGIGQEALYLLGHGLRIVGGHQQGVVPMVQKTGEAPHIGADHAEAAGHGLKH